MPRWNTELTVKSFVIKNGEKIPYDSLTKTEKKKVWDTINKNVSNEIYDYLNQHPERIDVFRNLTD